MKTNWNKQNIKYGESSYLKLVDKIEKQKNKPTSYKGTIETMLLEFFGKTSKKRYTWKRETFKGLLIQAYNQKCYALLRDYKSVEVLHNISAFGNQTVRDFLNWENNSFNKEKQLKSIIRYSFALYETPAFLENSFFGFEKKYMLWYIQLGKGKSVKALSQMPLSLTNKMAHEFKNAPDIFEANQALRYAQALGFGASIKTAKVIGFSRLSIIIDSEEKFWVTVVQFFAKESELQVKELESVLDYLMFKFRENQSFSMKGRTKKALLNQAIEWEREVYRKEIGEILNWETSGIRPLYIEKIENNKKVVYKTVELRNSIELYEEGNEMHHCIAEYDIDCVDGESAVFSLRKETEEEPINRLVTIEVCLKEKQIIEAKAKFNEEPNNIALNLIELWVNNSQLNKVKEMIVEAPNQQELNVQNVTINDEYNVIVIVKVIFWIIYFIAKTMMLSK